MRVHRRADVVRGAAVFHRQHHLAQQLAHVRADHVAAEHFVGAGVGHELHKAVCRAHGARATVRTERILAHLVRDSRRLDLGLRQAADRDFRPGVHHARHVLVVHVGLLPRDHFGGDHPLFLRLVREELSAHGVADREDVREVGTHLVVHEHFAARAELESECLGIDAGERRAAADRDEHIVRAEGAGRAVLLGADHHARAIPVPARHARAGVQLEPLLGEDARGFLRDVVVAAGEDRRRELEHGDHRSQATPDGAELEADHAATDHDEMLGHLRDPERTDVREDPLLVEGEVGQFHRHGAGGDDDVLRLVRDRRAVERSHIHHIVPLERAEALGPGDLVLLEEELDPLGVRGDDLLFALHHAREVEREPGKLDAVVGRVDAGELVVLGGAEERLGRDAPDIHAGAAQRLVEFDADDGEAQLGGADRGDVAAGSAADDKDVGSECRVGQESSGVRRSFRKERG